MDEARPDHATQMLDLTRARAEVIEPAMGRVWQSVEPCSAEEFAAIDLPDSLRRVGTGCGAMDEMWFDRSPGAGADGPMEERIIDGRRFAHCASPASAPSKPFGDAGPTEMSVGKFHALRFCAGRAVPVMRSPEGEFFVHVIDSQKGRSNIGLGTPSRGALVMPDECALGRVELDQDWILRLPNPTRVFFFPNGDSFQGPIESLPAEWTPLSDSNPAKEAGS